MADASALTRLAIDGSSAADESRRGDAGRFALPLLGTALAITYVVAAELGFQAAFVAPQVTTVWAPTGIGIAALVLWGRRLWPAIWIGAFLVNAHADAPLWAACIVASGNTIEAVAAASWLSALPAFDATLQRVADVVAYIGIGVVACPVLSATTGVLTLCGAGVQPWPRFASLWFDWWLGDALGALLVAPAIFAVVRCFRPGPGGSGWQPRCLSPARSASRRSRSDVSASARTRSSTWSSPRSLLPRSAAGPRSPRSSCSEPRR